jgi:SAM-dependent methyltransferase
LPQRARFAAISPWPQPWDRNAELDWSDPELSRRLLAEHLDQGHDGASRREAAVERQVRRLRRLLPAPPSDVLDAGCGPGLYAVRLAGLGYRVEGIDVGPAVIRHARALARRRGVQGLTGFRIGDIRAIEVSPRYDAVVLVYYVLENLPQKAQAAALRRLAGCLRPGGRLILELRLKPDQLPGRISAWEVTDSSLLATRRQLLLTDSVYDRARNLFVLREVSVFADGSLAVQQTTSRLTAFEEIAPLLGSADLRPLSIFDGWSARPGTPLSESVLVVAER